MLWEPVVLLVVVEGGSCRLVECLNSLVQLVRPLVQPFWWLVKGRLLLLVKGEKRRPAW